jgi:hypothetical protein
MYCVRFDGKIHGFLLGAAACAGLLAGAPIALATSVTGGTSSTTVAAPEASSPVLFAHQGGSGSGSSGSSERDFIRDRRDCVGIDRHGVRRYNGHNWNGSRRHSDG